MMDVGKILEKHMETQGLSVKELSAKSGVSQSTIKRILAGNGGNVRIETIVRLCIGLGVSLSEFLKISTF